MLDGDRRHARQGRMLGIFARYAQTSRQHSSGGAAALSTPRRVARHAFDAGARASMLYPHARRHAVLLRLTGLRYRAVPHSTPTARSARHVSLACHLLGLKRIMTSPAPRASQLFVARRMAAAASHHFCCASRRCSPATTYHRANDFLAARRRDCPQTRRLD